MRRGYVDMAERHKMLEAVKQAVEVIERACPGRTRGNRDRRAGAAGLLMERLAPAFALKNRINERNVENNVSLRDSFLKDLLRQKKIEVRHELLVRHIFGGVEEEDVDESTPNGSSRKRKK